MKTFFIFFLLLITTFSSCTKVSNGGIPSYLKLNKPVIQNTSPNQGSVNHDFTDLWIVSNGNNIGAYQYPITLPVLLEGEQEVTINPGIFYNANPLDRTIYSIFDPSVSTHTFIQKDTVEITPVFKYREAVSFLYIEDFESTNNFNEFTRTDLGDVNNLEGKAGVFTLSSTDQSKAALTINSLTIPHGKRIYLEFTLKTDSYVGLGFESTLNSDNFISLAVFEPNAEWHTYYFEISTFINQVKEGEYHFYLDAQKNIEGEEEKTYFDNFKIIQF